MTSKALVLGQDGLPQHGTYWRTRAPYHCHCAQACEPYRAGLRRREKQRTYDTANGRPWTVDADAARAFLLRANAAGASYTRIAQASGVSPTVVFAILHRGRTRIRYDTERRLLAVDVAALRPVSKRLSVPAVGTARRLRALAALGHSFRAVAAEMGVSHQHVSMVVNGRVDSVSQGMAMAADRVYGVLSMRTGTNAANRTRALREGWAPPMAWEYVDIDDPKARPRGMIRDIDHANRVA